MGQTLEIAPWWIEIEVFSLQKGSCSVGVRTKEMENAKKVVGERSETSRGWGESEARRPLPLLSR